MFEAETILRACLVAFSAATLDISWKGQVEDKYDFYKAMYIVPVVEGAGCALIPMRPFLTWRGM
jgi:hypothetical protein